MPYRHCQCLARMYGRVVRSALQGRAHPAGTTWPAVRSSLTIAESDTVSEQSEEERANTEVHRRSF